MALVNPGDAILVEAPVYAGQQHHLPSCLLAHTKQL